MLLAMKCKRLVWIKSTDDFVSVKAYRPTDTTLTIA